MTPLLEVDRPKIADWQLVWNPSLPREVQS